MGTMRHAFATALSRGSLTDTIAEMAKPSVEMFDRAFDRAKFDADKERRLEQKKARLERDRLIADIHAISYTRGGKLVPRRKELRPQLDRFVRAAKMAAEIARPEFGYPDPSRFVPVRDPEYPAIDETSLIAERNRLTIWYDVLESRGADEEVLGNIAAHLYRLNRRLTPVIRQQTINARGRRVIVEKKS